MNAAAFMLSLSLLRGDLEALLGEVLRGARMIRNVGDGGGKLKAQLFGLGVRELADVVEDSGDEVVDVGLGDIVTRDDYGATATVVTSSGVPYTSAAMVLGL